MASEVQHWAKTVMEADGVGMQREAAGWLKALARAILAQADAVTAGEAGSPTREDGGPCGSGLGSQPPPPTPAFKHTETTVTEYAPPTPATEGDASALSVEYREALDFLELCRTELNREGRLGTDSDHADLVSIAGDALDGVSDLTAELDTLRARLTAQDAVVAAATKDVDRLDWLDDVKQEGHRVEDARDCYWHSGVTNFRDACDVLMDESYPLDAAEEPADG